MNIRLFFFSDVEINALIEDISFEIISDRVEIHARLRRAFEYNPPRETKKMKT